MSKRVDFIFDFGSPNACLAYWALPPILERTGARLNLIPCLLGGIFKATGNQSPVFAFEGVKGKLDYEYLEIDRFVRRHGLERFSMNPHFPVNTLMLMRGAVAAEADGQLDAYLDAGLTCLWEKGLKMDDPEVFAAGLKEQGLDGAAMLERTADPAVKAALAANTAAAVERGCFGVPTFFVGNEMFFGKDRLAQLEEELQA